MQLLDRPLDIILKRDDIETDKISEWLREEIDPEIFEGIALEYEDLLLNDGHCEITVCNADYSLQTRLCFAKHFAIYGSPQEQFESTLEHHQIRNDEELRVIGDGPNNRKSSKCYHAAFSRFCVELNAEAD